MNGRPEAGSVRSHAVLAWEGSTEDRRRPVGSKGVGYRYPFDEGLNKLLRFGFLDSEKLRRFIIQCDQIDCTELAVFAMFLECKLAFAENDGILVGVVLVMKEACADLGKPQSGDQQNGN